MKKLNTTVVALNDLVKFNEIEKDITYEVKSKVSHLPQNCGMLRGPSVKIDKYNMTFPLHAIKKNFLKVKDGEIGRIIKVILHNENEIHQNYCFLKNSILALEVTWKEAIGAYYKNPVFMKPWSKNYRGTLLEDLFEIIKKDYVDDS